jgi:FkbM family methyltransferase
MAYSQSNEEAVILSAAEEAKCVRGRFLDIGAYDGKTFSNTLRLSELGWSGVCVEPSPTAFAGLIKTHRENPQIVLVNAAITPDGGWLDFYDSNGDALSTSDLQHVDKWVKAHNVPFTRFLLRSVSVEELLARFGRAYEFINIDVEGGNLALFHSFRWELFSQTRIICVEHDNRVQEMLARVAPLGFVIAAINSENLILKRP